MGLTARFDHPDYENAVQTILHKCQEYGVMPGIHVVQPNPEEVQERVKQGFKMIAYSLDITMIGKACIEGIKSIRNSL